MKDEREKGNSNSKSTNGEMSRREFLKTSGVAFAAMYFGEINKLFPGTGTYDRATSKINKSENLQTGEVDFLATHEVSCGDTARPVVLMTYDDFNSHDNINTILDAYKDHNFKTTFFFPGGYDRKYITLGNYAKEIERIVDEGHVFGCHGFLHDPLTTYNPGQIRSDVERWLGIVKDIIPGYQVKWMRYPYGDRNQDTRNIFAEYGMQSVMWSLESGGTDKGTYERVTSKVKKGDIVLNHTHRYYDAYEAHQILDYMNSKNLTVESIATGLSSVDYYQQKQIPERTKQVNSLRKK